MIKELDLLSSYWVESGLSVVDPGTGAELGVVSDYSVDDVTTAIAVASAAQNEWSARTAKERSNILRRWFELLQANAENLAQICTMESGKPLVESRGEVSYAASFIEWFAEEAKRINGDILPAPWVGKEVLVHKLPIGVTAAITPWNFPLAMITRKAGPALAAGCPMIVKPAANTPLSALAMEKLAHDAGVPRDVFRVCPGSASSAIGKLFCESKIIRKLSFTGSTAIGKIIMRQAADTVTRLSLELGGNAPFIVFADADLDDAVDGAIASKYRNAGQTCVCANRFLVAEEIHDEFVRRLTEKVNAMTIGHGADEATQIGPLIDRKAVSDVAQLVSQAISDGAQLVAGQIWQEEDGNFHTPCILTDVTADMEIAKTEIFGPIATIISFTSEAEAIRIANDTPYGLAAYAYTKDQSCTWRLMRQLEYGMVGINEGILSTEIAPFGGVKESGLGREGSQYGIDEYLELKYCLLGGLET